MSISLPRDNNRVTVIGGTSSTDGKTVTPIYVNPVNNRMLVDLAGAVILETNGTPNGSQTTLNLVAGTNITLTDNGAGSVTIASSGSGGTPGGSTTQVQYNNAGSFAGSSKLTFDGNQLLVQDFESILWADQFAGADIGAQINAAYAALPSTGGIIMIPSGTYSFSTGIVFATNNKFASLKSLSGSATFLKYTPTSGNAITINHGNPTGHLVSEISGFTLMGKSTLIAAGQTNTNTSIGIYYGGTQGAVGVNTHDMNINGFGTNWLIGQNAYMLSFKNCANSGGNGGQSTMGSLVHINAANNSGERNVFESCAFTDPGNSLATNAIYITNAGTASNFFAYNSFDDVQLFIGASNGQTLLVGNHIENSAFGTYGQYIPILGVSSDQSTSITMVGNEFANDGNSSGNTFVTLVKHGGNFFSSGTMINNYGGQTITAFVDHSLDNGKAVDLIGMTQIQGGGLTSLIAGSGGVAYTPESGATWITNVSNSYSIGMRAKGSNTNEIFSGSSTVGTFDHSGNWVFGLSGGTSSVTIPGEAFITNTNTVLDASQFAGSDIGAKINAAYAQAVANSLNGVIITVPAGTFSFSTPIAISTDGFRATIKGTGGDGTVLTYTGSSSTKAITFNCGYQGDGAGSEHITYVGLQDITIKGNDSTSASAKIGVYLGGTNGAAGIVLRNVKIETFGQGLYFGANTYHTLMDSVVIRNCAQLMYIAASSNSGEGLTFVNCFMVDPFDTTYVTANGVQIADSGTASARFVGCSFDDTQVRIGQANNVTFVGTHWENPGSANWGAYTYLSIDSNLATNVSLNGDTFFATGSTSPTAYFANGGNLTMNAVIIRKFTGSTMTNMGSLTGTGRVTWSGLNNASGTAITNVVSTAPYTPSGFANQAGNVYTLDASAIMTVPSVIYPSNAIAAVSNAATVPVTSRVSTVTNNSAATLTVTLTTSGAKDGQFLTVRIYDFSAVAQTITWINTENSNTSAPTTSNGSTTLPITIGYQFNGQTSKWRCIAFT
jgi:hypothetical protein